MLCAVIAQVFEITENIFDSLEMLGAIDQIVDKKVGVIGGFSPS